MLGIALGWKYAHHPGIRTKGDKIIAWPSTLGTPPTENQITEIINDYKSFIEANPKLTREAKIKLIEDSNSLQDLKVNLIKVLF